MKQAPPPQKGPEDWQPTDRTMSLSALSRVDSARSDTADSTACTEYAVSCPDFHDLGVNVYKVGDNIESVSWEWVKSAQSAPPKEKKEIPCGGEQDVAGW